MDQIYLKMPRLIQNVALSLYGFQQNKIRYSSEIPDPYAAVFSGEDVSLDAMKDIQNRRLRALVSYAIENVPYYRDLGRQHHIAVGEVTVDNVASVFPVLTKELIKENPERFHTTIERDRGIKLFTSGTSGSPMPIVSTGEARALNYRYFRKIIRAQGCDIGDRKVVFAGRVLFSERERSVFWRKDFYNKTLYCSSYRMSADTVSKYVSAISAWNPKFIDCYPSAIFEIANEMLRKGVSPNPALRFIFTSSETLSDVQRQTILDAFRVPIVDQYGCTEMAVMAHSQGERYCVEPMYGLVEVGASLDGECYPLICTGLLNVAMPLIRYQIGDLVREPLVDAEFPLQKVSFSSIVGREDDCIVTPEGRQIGRMDPAFKGVLGVSKAQIIQKTEKHLTVLVVSSSDGFSEASKNNLIENIKKRTSPLMDVEVVCVADIPLTKAGKFKSVVSALSSGLK